MIMSIQRGEHAWRWLGEFDFEFFFALSLVLPLFVTLVDFAVFPSCR
jgi:hypothetical protein